MSFITQFYYIFVSRKKVFINLNWPKYISYRVIAWFAYYLSGPSSKVVTAMVYLTTA